MFIGSILIILAVGIGLYWSLALTTLMIIREDLDNAKDCTFYPYAVRNYITMHMLELTKLLPYIWWVYLFFRVGALFGRKIYFKIVKNNEDRIAAWFI